MNLQQLEYIDAVSRHRSLRAAAESLGVTPQALSRAIGALERELGGEVFERAAGGVAFTAFGRAVHERAVRALRLRDQIVQAVSHEERRSIRIGIGYFFTMTRLSEHVTRALAALDYGRIEFVEGANVELSPIVASGELDLAFTSVIQPGPRVTFRKLLDFGWAIAHRKGHPIAGPKGGLEKAAEYGFVTASSPSGHAQLDAAIKALAGKPARIVSTSASTVQILRTIGASDLLSVAPDDVSPGFLNEAGVELMPAPSLPRREYGLLCPRRPPIGLDWDALTGAAEAGVKAFLSTRSAAGGRS
ncbi:MAG: LysR family transcriptional regulator [Oceanicaulis sp.]